jgi:3-oxoacyl-[acyl-carrier protein] reductase
MATLLGKTALVSGAAHGLGAATAEALARAGANLIIHFRASEAEAKALAESVQATGPRAVALGADLTSIRETEHLIVEASRTVGPPDILINNVGDFLWKDAADTTFGEWKTLLSSNLDTMFHLTRCCLPHMRREKWGRIVNLTASAVDRGGASPHTAAYTAAKAAVWSLTRSLAREELGHGITVNAVAPGLIDTGDDRISPEVRARMLDIAPTGELGTPGDVARVIEFLVRPESGFITGAQIPVAGGFQL